jgi:hypothetical protein
MGRQMRGALGALLTVGIALAVSAPATAQTTGNETFKGVIVTSGLSGARVVVNSVVVAKGVFRGVGRIVEIENLPTDPDNVSRDDLVFADGSIHLLSTTLGFSFDINSSELHRQLQPAAGRDSRRRHWAVRGCDRQLHRDGHGAGACAPQPRRQLLPGANGAPRGRQDCVERDAVALRPYGGCRPA